MPLGFTSFVLCCKWQRKLLTSTSCKRRPKAVVLGQNQDFLRSVLPPEAPGDNVFLCLLQRLKELLWLIVSSSIFKSSSVASSLTLFPFAFFTWFSLCQIFCSTLLRTLVIAYRAHPDNSSNYSLPSKYSWFNHICKVTFLPYELIFLGSWFRSWIYFGETIIHPTAVRLFQKGSREHCPCCICRGNPYFFILHLQSAPATHVGHLFHLVLISLLYGAAGHGVPTLKCRAAYWYCFDQNKNLSLI